MSTLSTLPAAAQQQEQQEEEPTFVSPIFPPPPPYLPHNNHPLTPPQYIPSLRLLYRSPYPPNTPFQEILNARAKTDGKPYPRNVCFDYSYLASLETWLYMARSARLTNCDGEMHVAGMRVWRESTGAVFEKLRRVMGEYERADGDHYD